MNFLRRIRKTLASKRAHQQLVQGDLRLCPKCHDGIQRLMTFNQDQVETYDVKYFLDAVAQNCFICVYIWQRFHDSEREAISRSKKSVARLIIPLSSTSNTGGLWSFRFWHPVRDSSDSVIELELIHAGGMPYQLLEMSFSVDSFVILTSYGFSARCTDDVPTN